MFFKQGACHYRDPSQPYLHCLLRHASRVLGIEFHENCTNEGRVTSEKVLCSSSKVPFIVNRSQTRHSSTVLIVKFPENPSVWKPIYIREGTFSIQAKGPSLLIDRNQTYVSEAY